MKDDKRELYSLIINQLVYDGYINEAINLSQTTTIPCPLRTDSSNKLYTIFQNKSNVASGGTTGTSSTSSSTSNGPISSQYNDDSGVNGGGSQGDTGSNSNANVSVNDDCFLNRKISGLDIDNPVSNPNSVNSVSFITKFITTHKNACRCARFSWDGKFLATGSSDTSIKLLDVDKMKNYNQNKNETTEDFAPSRPVIRTYYDHTQPVNDLDFHPSAPILVSGSKDCTIRFYDYKSSIKRSFKFIQDPHSVRSLNFHPVGDMLLVGAEHHMIRLYNVNTFQSYTARKINEHHHDSINMVRYSLDGSIFASCSKDGNIKVWDSLNFSLINTIQMPHSGKEVTSVQISRNQKYLLSCGRDSLVKLWELSSGRVVHTINTGVNQNTKNRLQAIFNYNEDFIITNDEQPQSCVVYNSRTCDIVQKLTGHIQTVRSIASSPIENTLMTCSNDHRSRFWCEDLSMSNQQQSSSHTREKDIDMDDE
ncbi:WD40 repeat-containing protein [Tieghemostelium lacteum]|uniref:Cleavage stimulation factor 50 kDa subunit n=1 Tax=Tieghemostelium lacteum TaxID=361077 RepID=A0A151Z3L9_TIELA|nr:WD40 repeat-containing protein [Tieghemostelium lacteum]|eukprot:KYQ88556.1 WD40 repeat-containing protein [Tieghemostelium lacteum]